jgi:hypothetical protein
MPYKYTNAFMTVNETPQDTYKNFFQANLTEQFYNATDWYTIQEELVFASGTFSDTDVRITHAIDAKTGTKMGDDYKFILFKDIEHATGLGYLYYFDDNYWLTINSEIIKNLAASCTVKRCNNTLRWMDTAGAVYSVPCSIEMDKPISNNRDMVGISTSVIIPMGLIQVRTQYNSTSNKIKPNQRFLLGNADNWIAWKVVGGGVENYNNLQTEINTTPGLITFTLDRNYENVDTDDLTNGIAGVAGDVYTITLSNSTLTSTVGYSIQLTATVKLNGEVVNRTVVWSNDNDSLKATVSSSGLVSMVAAGTATITATLDGNEDVSATCVVTVGTGSTSTYQIIVTPGINYVLEGTTQIFDIRLWLNNTQEANAFTFTLDAGDVPSANYTYAVLSSYSFYIQNLAKYLEDTITIHCVSGSYTKDLIITLKGRW